MSTRRRTQSASTPSYTRPVDPVPVPVIARRPDTIVGFGEACIRAETATFEVRVSEVANPRPDDQLTVGGDTFVARASRSGAIPIGSCGQSMCGLREPANVGRAATIDRDTAAD